MSFFSTYNPLPAAPGLLAGALGKLITPKYTARSIGGIVVQATLEEAGTDTLTITDHPVEVGAQVTDHAFLNPAELDIEVGYGAGNIQSMSDLYQQFLNLQATRKPFQIVTGKRIYSNMLLQSINQTTDSSSENSLTLRLHCKQIITVATSVTPLSSAANMANPSATAPAVSAGTVQPVIPASTPSGVFATVVP